MKAYVIIQVKVDNPELLKPYQEKAPLAIKKYNGKVLARGGEIATLEGKNSPDRVVVIEFPTLQEAKNFYFSEEYNEAKLLRENKAEFEIIVTEGVS